MSVFRVYMKTVNWVNRVIRRVRPSKTSPFALLNSTKLPSNDYFGNSDTLLYQSTSSFRTGVVKHGTPLAAWSLGYLYAAAQLSIKISYATLVLGLAAHVFAKSLSHRYFFIHRMSLAHTGTILLMDIGKVTGDRFLSAANIDEVVFHSPPKVSEVKGRFYLTSPVLVTVKSLYSAFGCFKDVKLSLMADGEVMIPEIMKDVAEQREIDMETGARVETRTEGRKIT